MELILDIVRIQTFEQHDKDPQMKLKISFHFWSRLEGEKKKLSKKKTNQKRSIKSTKKSTISPNSWRIKQLRSAYTQHVSSVNSTCTSVYTCGWKDALFAGIFFTCSQQLYKDLLLKKLQLGHEWHILKI